MLLDPWADHPQTLEQLRIRIENLERITTGLRAEVAQLQADVSALTRHAMGVTDE